MATDYNRVGPAGHKAGHVFTDDRGAKNSAAQNIADGAVRAAPHLFQAEFFNPVLVWCDGRTFDAYTVFLNGVSRINSDLVIGFIAHFHAQIVIFQVNIQIGQDQLFLDEIPDDAGHFVAV